MLLLHGGGQTRHAWRKTGELIARLGRVAYAVDQRGHGDSEWVADGAYAVLRFRRRRAGAGRYAGRAQRRAAGGGRRLARRHRGAAGGRRAGRPPDHAVFSALVLVDITPRVDLDGRREDPGLHARAAAKASARSPRPPTRSPPICRTGRGRARMRG